MHSELIKNVFLWSHVFGSAGGRVVGRGSPGLPFSFSDIPQTQIDWQVSHNIAELQRKHKLQSIARLLGIEHFSEIM